MYIRGTTCFIIIIIIIIIIFFYLDATYLLKRMR